jgi:hypothetical protein
VPRFAPEKPFDVTSQFSARFDEYDAVTLVKASAPLTPFAASYIALVTRRPSSADTLPYFGSSSCRSTPA